MFSKYFLEVNRVYEPPDRLERYDTDAHLARYLGSVSRHGLPLESDVEFRRQFRYNPEAYLTMNAIFRDNVEVSPEEGIFQRVTLSPQYYIAALTTSENAMYPHPDKDRLQNVVLPMMARQALDHLPDWMLTILLLGGVPFPIPGNAIICLGSPLGRQILPQALVSHALKLGATLP